MLYLKKIICIGDSLTTGFGVHRNESWFHIVKQTLPDFEFINKGTNGDTTTGILSRFYTDVISNNPDTILLMAGSNDFLSGKSVEFVMDNLKLMIKDLKDNNIDFIIGIPTEVVGTMAKVSWSPYVDYSILNSSVYCYKNILSKYCIEHNIPHVNFYNIINTALKTHKENDLFVDGLHPTSYGHCLMAKELLNILDNKRSN